MWVVSAIQLYSVTLCVGWGQAVGGGGVYVWEKQSFLKEISPGYSLEGLMLKLKLQYFGHVIQRTDSFEKTLMLAKIEGRRRWDDRGWDGWMASPTQWIWVWVSSRSWWCTGKPGMLQSMGSQRVGHYWATELTDSNMCAVVTHCGFN